MTGKMLCAGCALALAMLSAGCMGGAKRNVLGFVGRRKAPDVADARDREDARDGVPRRATQIAAPALSPDEFKRRDAARNDFARDDFSREYALSSAEQYAPAPYSPAEFMQTQYPAAPSPYASAAPAGDYALYQASRGAERLGGYDRPADSLENGAAARVRMPAPPESRDNGESMLFASSGGSGGPVAQPFAGAHVGRSNFTKTTKTAKNAQQAPVPPPPGDARKPWENGSLFRDDAGNVASAPARTAVPNIHASRFHDAGGAEMWPAGTAMAAPAGSFDVRSAPKTEVRLSAPAPRLSVPAPATPPAPREAADDGVFSPSMLLGSGR